jgi:Rrf2 family protein
VGSTRFRKRQSNERDLILLELKQARMVESVRGAKGGYCLKRLPSEIFLGEIIRTIDRPWAPFEDAESLRRHVKEDSKHSALFQVLLSLGNAAAGILDRTYDRRQRGPRRGD